MNRIKVNKPLVIECLAELSDIEYQMKAWISGMPSQATGFYDTISALFDDSALGEALIKNNVTFTYSIDEMLRLLDRKITKLPKNMGTIDVVKSPTWLEVKKLAEKINKEINCEALGTKCRR